MLNSDSRRRGASESLKRHAFPVIQAKSTKKESILPDIIYTALKAISKVSEGCPFPPIVFAAQLAVDIWDKVVEIKQNKAGFRNLAYAAGDTIKTIWDELERQVDKSGTKISDSFAQSVDDLSRVVSSIHDLVCDYAGRGFFQRLFCANNDLGSIAGFQQDLEQARKNFELVAMVGIRATVERIEHNQHHPSGSSPAQGPFANMTVHNTGGGTFNNVVGNQYNDFATAISSRGNHTNPNPNLRANSGSAYGNGANWRRRGEAMRVKGGLYAFPLSNTFGKLTIYDFDSTKKARSI
ncbi:hypothetical protein PC9H_004538 [Pleurotus ostreatus]|uniref:Uncharacterized protein n=1 Tax=Pleurotus ostreatus TaxID=5322 RepID=A0A8H6ZXE4_PLEOS|nr:uncharacterized protein PC9H_004538 [Pleurotus ostreatus]KAF7432596.1 hypothetical protein PC9H_004538 [Pleurotus ostreatus]